MAAKRVARPVKKPARPARASPSTAKRKKVPGADALTQRVERAIEHELSRIEAVLSDGGEDGARGEAERRARTLATLARTLKEVTRLRAGEEKTKAADDELPRDLDEFRRELSRRLDLLVAEAAALHPEPAERG
ncbi:MAG: hypothetical protein EPO23_00400 [Xanthobacteraceae bacterium]|nr:MAG: hypothetical protein EPO23_00400 [Xanthobacteraceae bacterium]